MGFPTTSVRFSESLGLTELSKAVKLLVTVYYSAKVQIKISSRRRHIGQEPGDTSYPLPVESLWTMLNSPSNNV